MKLPMNNRTQRIHFLLCLYFFCITAVFAHAQEAKITSLIQQLEHTSVTVRYQAREALLEIGAPALPKLMENALGHAFLIHMRAPLEDMPPTKTETEKVSYQIRYGCAEILIELGKTAVPALIEVWRGDEEFSQFNARLLLTRMGKPALDAFIAELEAENPVMRRRAIFALSDLMAYSKHPLAPQTAFLTLAPRKALVGAIIKAVKIERIEDDPENFELAVTNFYRHGEVLPEGIPTLIELLHYGYGSPRHYPTGEILVLCMGAAGQKAFAKALESRNWNLRFGAALDYAELFDAVFYSPHRDLPGDKMAKIADVVDPLPATVVPILAEGLKHPDKRVQKRAAQALGKLAECNVPEARKIYNKHFPPEPPQVPLSRFPKAVRLPKASQIIYGEVVETAFVPREAIGHRITTDVTLQILDQIKGDRAPNQNRVTFMIPGGILPDGSVVAVEGAPGFQTGEKVIVFLTTKKGEPKDPPHPHGGLTLLKNAKLAIVNNKASIPYRVVLFRIARPGIASTEEVGFPRITLPITFVVKFAKAALIGAEAVFPIDQELNRRVKIATELPPDNTYANTLLNPSPKDLAPLNAQLDAILEGQNPNETKVKKGGANRNR